MGFAYHQAMTGAQAADHVGRYSPRLDVSRVPAQGGHVAKQCPLRVQYDVLPPGGVVPCPPADVEGLRAEAAAALQAEVIAQVEAQHPDALVVDRRRLPVMQVAETLLAMGEGVPVVVGGRLPTDVIGRRTGRPDLLVRAERRPDGRWAYHPVEVRNHRTLDLGAPKEPSLAALVSTTEAPWLASGRSAGERTTRTQQGDRLQLAHLHRVLEQTPHGSADAAGAVIGTEREVVWHRLDAAVIQHRWDRVHATIESPLVRYDLEFSFRLDVLAAAAADQPMVGPVAVGECATCPWRGHCRPAIEADDSTSLLPGFGYRQWYNLARQGITTRAQLAALDLRTALVRDTFEAPGDLAALVRFASTQPPGTPVAQVIRTMAGAGPHLGVPPDEVSGRPGLEAAVLATAAHAVARHGDDVGARVGWAEAAASADVRGSGQPTTGPSVDGGRRVAALAAHGVTIASHLVALDPVVVSLADQPIRRLAEAVQGAQALAAGRPLLRHGVEQLVVPSADLEIDIDMESALEGAAYLWGAWVDGAYHAAVSWDPPSPEMEAQVFAVFWDWLTAERRAAVEHGRSVAIYCWFKGAESRALRRGAKSAAEVLGRTEAPAEVEELLDGSQFVDLYEVFTTQLLTGGSAGLKAIATLAGFRWRDTDPNGADSMAWHAQAVDDSDPDRQSQARQRLLAYNEDDVLATSAVRHWLRTTLDGIPDRAEVDQTALTPAAPSRPSSTMVS